MFQRIKVTNFRNILYRIFPFFGGVEGGLVMPNYHMGYELAVIHIKH